MAASPDWKIYFEGEYLACCKCPEDAAAVVGLRGIGGVVKWRHKHVMWREGHEMISAAESYDETAEIMVGRLRKLNARREPVGFTPRLDPTP